MSVSTAAQTLDRFAVIGDLAARVRFMLGQTWIGGIAMLGGAVVTLFYNSNPGTIAFALLALGTVAALGIWQSHGIGLPILPLLVIQNLFIYGIPILTHHEVVDKYPEELLTDCGLEVLVFSLSLAAVWRAGMQVFQPSPPVCYALPDFQRGGSGKLKSFGMILMVAGTFYQILDKLEILWLFYAMLPAGSSSLMLPLAVALSTCGSFLVALFLGSNELKLSEQVFFWCTFALTCTISASGLLLSGVTTYGISVFVGLFWSQGRIPWRYLGVMVALLSFLNLGKFTMRERYWNSEDETRSMPSGLTGMASVYGEWVVASFDAVGGGSDATPVGPESSREESKATRQTLLERLNNLQNLLFVVDAIEMRDFPPLGGSSYSLIVPLLVPRIMWPDKPRSHAGQVLLNVHFGRQDLNSTYRTYIAWGLIPEAYGNFGAITGSLLLGTALGLACAWIEAFTARKLLLSLEGFVCFVIVLGMANSFEFVASVLVTTIFQSVVPIVFVSLPFLRRMTVRRPAAN